MMDRAAIETDRLCLRPLVPADAGVLHALTDHPAIIAAISFLRAPFTLADAAALIATNETGCDVFRSIRRRGDEALIGGIGVHEQGTGALEIGYWIGTRFQRQGYAFEAASGVIGRVKTVFPETRIVAECRPENRASWRILERLGFRPTGMPGARPGRLVLALD